MPKNETQHGSGFQERTRTKIDEPKQYKVILHNDDITTMDFVIVLLENVFHKSEAEAYTLMMAVHREGKATVGVYTYDIAMTLQRKAVKMARAEKFPLKITVEPA